MLLVALYSKKKGIIIKYCHEFTFPITFQQTNGMIWKEFMRVDMMPSPYYAIFDEKEIIIKSSLPDEDIPGYKAKGYRLENITRKCYPYLDFEKLLSCLKYVDVNMNSTLDEIKLAVLSSMQFYADIDNMINKELNQFPDL